MPELVFELGCEELPASQVRKAASQLCTEVCVRLQEKLVACEGAQVFATPRRIIVGLAQVDGRQSDETKRSRGPQLSAAYGPDGEPTKALEGFLRGQGAAPQDVEQEGGYAWVTKVIPGRATSEVLAEILPAAIRALAFDKTMRWGSGSLRFARPIRWILARFAGEVVAFSVEGVESGGDSRGHRFLANETFAAGTLDELLRGLRQRFVEPDASERERLIREGLEKTSGGRAVVTDDLVDENTYLTEWPMPTLGVFHPRFMELPEPVLVTAMAKHERMFPVRGDDGRLTNEFVFVRNGGEEARVSAGNTWVLNARFNDAKFFFDEDASKSLDDFLARTEGMALQAGLGSIRQKADRLADLTRFLVVWAEEPLSLADLGAQAGFYAKADLASGLVSELSSLQGVVGGEYAAREGLDPLVCEAISRQYDLKGSLPLESDGRRLGALLLCADQLDKLAAYLGSGMAPTGTADPFALRRAATLLIEAAWAWPHKLGSWDEALAYAGGLLQGQGLNHDPEGAKASLIALFSQRYEALLSDSAYDVRGAAVSPEAALHPRLVRTRSEAMAVLKGDAEFIQALTRPINLASSAAAKGEAFGEAEAALDSDLARTLAESMVSARMGVELALAEEDGRGVAESLRPLAQAVGPYLDATMVMDPDPTTRAARLELMRECASIVSLAGSVGSLVIE
jgi:glycyl-tRNA synthetase beta chain